MTYETKIVCVQSKYGRVGNVLSWERTTLTAAWRPGQTIQRNIWEASDVFHIGVFECIFLLLSNAPF